MLTIWKYTINIADDTADFLVPVDAVLVHIGPEPSDPDNFDLICLWFHVETDNRLVRREFLVRGTGQSVGSRKYLGSVIIKPFAWHVFE